MPLLDHGNIRKGLDPAPPSVFNWWYRWWYRAPTWSFQLAQLVDHNPRKIGINQSQRGGLWHCFYPHDWLLEIANNHQPSLSSYPSYPLVISERYPWISTGSSKFGGMAHGFLIGGSISVYSIKTITTKVSEVS